MHQAQSGNLYKSMRGVNYTRDASAKLASYKLCDKITEVEETVPFEGRPTR